MLDSSAALGRPLRILHVLRAPLGGLFRHVLDVAREQIERGHAVGIIADALTGGEAANRVLADLSPRLSLGLSRVPMLRRPALSDAAALAHVLRRCRTVRPDVVHGHGSKGGIYARATGLFPATADAIRVYTPHGGSLNYRPGSLSHRVYMTAERLSERATDLLLFESAFIASRYETQVCRPRGLTRIVPNGIASGEFNPVVPRPDAADFLAVGELRFAKGLDVLLDALAELRRRRGRPVTARLVGSGPDRAALAAKAEGLGLSGSVTIADPMPARLAFSTGRILVVPSRAESMPYIVLEAAAAQIPMIATNVGGIPEIFGPQRDRLIEAGDVNVLAAAMEAAMAMPAEAQARQTAELAAFIRCRFSVGSMVDQILEGYHAALRARQAGVAATLTGTSPVAALDSRHERQP